MFKSHSLEVSSGDRFKFGENWAHFILLLDDERIHAAEVSLKEMLGIESLEGKRFIDIGSGSGLFSLAARRLGAKVHSFDYDSQSVACTLELKRRYFPADADWTIEEASVLDREYLKSNGTYDIVYSWGVLHHTGRMWEALGNVAELVRPNGKLFIAIYNDQGAASKFWKAVKRVYCSGFAGRVVMTGIYSVYYSLGRLIKDVCLLKNPFIRYQEYKQQRGMSVSRDLIDWIGGYPFEVAKPEEIFYFYQKISFTLERLKTCAGGLGCNEFLFVKNAKEL